MKKYKVPKLPVVSIILMMIFLVGGSLLIAVKGAPVYSFGLDLPSLIVCFLSYLLIAGGAFYYAFFEKTD